MTVGFDPDAYNVMEGMTAALNLVLMGESSIPVTVELNTQDGTAIGRHIKAGTWSLASVTDILYIADT